MAGFGMILAGAAQGWSDARLDEIKAEREARLQELEAQRQDRRLADERKFRHDEAEIGRNFESSESQKARDAAAAQRAEDRKFTTSEREAGQEFTAGQNKDDRTYRSDEAQKERDYRSTEADKNRQSSGDLVTGENGTSYSRVGSKVAPITDDQGNPIKLATAGSTAAKPAEVSTAEWLVQQGVAPDAATAWKMVRSARADPDKSRASIFKAWMDALTKGALGTPDAAELQRQAQEATDKTLRYLDEEGGAGSGAAPAQDSAPADVIPSDPAKRVIGKTYTNRNGQKAIWKGNGWELVQ